MSNETSQLLPKKVHFENDFDGIDLSDKRSRSLYSPPSNQEQVAINLPDQNDTENIIQIGDEEAFPAATSSKISHIAIILLLASLVAFDVVLDSIKSLKRKFDLKAPILILISLDGTRPEYLRRGITPNLQKLASNGIVHDMVPSFPSITFPNHYTLVTGIYPETHGIVGNTFFDPIINDTFSYTSPLNNGESRWWSAAEPIWITARKQGLISATCFWPGSEAEHDGLRPNFWRKFQYVSVEEELEWVKEWIEQPNHLAPDLVTLYIPHIDAAGHTYGPDSSQLNESLIEVDTKIGNLIEFLTVKKMYEKTNIVIVSDRK
jgi:predicted AlkP superfamily pyrophosphatase or phosphodiesterase